MRLLALKSILVATDLDEGSQPALRTGARLATLADARLHLVHVAVKPEADSIGRVAAHFRAIVSDGAEPDDVEVATGNPAEAIIAHARKVDADVVVLGPHRRVGSHAAMGSTAARVVRTAPCPCLVAAVELSLPLERVLAPIDLSEIAGGALSVALSWASALRPREGDAQLTALHVTTDPQPPDAARSVQQEVERARARAGGAARVEIRERITAASDPVEAILHNAASERVNLVVMGTRGAARAVSGLGSVAAAVARVTPCPLLLVPAATWQEHNQPFAAPDAVRAR